MSRQEEETRTGRYMYAVVAGSGYRNYNFSGIDGGAVYTICNGQSAAVVSDVPNEKIRPVRRRLAAHQEVLKRLMEESTALPTAFGIIADGPQAVREILSRHREAIGEQLRRVDGKEEWGLRVTWDVPDIFKYFVNTHPELRAARDRHCGPGREEKIELGKRFERVLNEDRDDYTEKVEEALSRYCFEIKRNKCRNEQEAMNLACLVGREARDEFETGVSEAARMFDDNFTFDYKGPWVPHNFVDIDLSL